MLVKKVAALMPTSLKIPMTGAGAAATVDTVEAVEAVEVVAEPELAEG